MKYNEVGFRPIYHHFIIVPMKGSLKVVIESFPGSEDADGILTYGYFDKEAGLTLEILSVVINNGNSFCDVGGNSTVSAKIRIGSVENDELIVIDDVDREFEIRYKDKLENIHKIYDSSNKVEETRNISVLDSARHEQYIDDVRVYILKDGNEPEGCWVRIREIVKVKDRNGFSGVLLNEPYQDFGCHKGDVIVFYVGETDKGEVICYSDMD